MQRASLKCMWLLATVVVCSVLVDAHTHDDGRTDGDDHTPHHRCVHDELMQLMREERGNVALPLARTGANVVGAALADGGRGRKEEVWAPIRIKVFTPDLHPRQFGETSYCSAAGQVRSDFKNKQFVCTEDDVLTDEKRRIIEEVLVPAAVQLHRERLLVVPTEGRVYVPYLGNAWSLCRSFYIPPSHIEEGVVDADFILYISSVPTDVDTSAWALTCSNHHDGRPAVAVANMNPRYIRADRRAIRTLAHEILHGLGFNSLSFAGYDMIGRVNGLRGRPGWAPLMVTPIVSAVARIHFQCDEMVGMELESDGGSGTMGSHWKRRSAKDELMSPIPTDGSFYTALTIAAMESFPFYKGNYSNAETMSWGHNAGCTLINEKCVENGVSRYPSMFCSSANKDLCDSSRLGVGRCSVAAFPGALPPYFQYFAEWNVGGGSRWMEHCPIVEMFSNGRCATGDERALPGSIFSSTSRCLNAPSVLHVSPGYTAGAVCVEVNCDRAREQYSVLFKGSNVWMPCPFGEVVNPSSVSNFFLDGSVSCPPFEEVC